ncbi:MAG: DUF1963 domain-containing protein [Alphaproteobacteria bacterium]|nr:DUF1963 domain-containing protein [Alphaproteobacteria bacterium]
MDSEAGHSAKAAVLAGEDEVLFPWLDAPTSDAAVVYADWLEEQGDARRAAAVKSHVAWLEGRGAPVDPDGLPTTWARTVGITAAHGLAELELPAELLALARPALILDELPATVPIGQSKLGGHPDLPRGTPWPCVEDATDCWDGLEDLEPTHAMMFVGQIRMEELRGMHAARILPDAGLLSVFAYVEVEEIGTLAFHLRFSADAGDLVRVEAPALHDVNRVTPERALRISETLELPMPRNAGPFQAQVPDERVPEIELVNARLGKPDATGMLGHVRGTTNAYDFTPDASYIKLAGFWIDPDDALFAHLMIRAEDLAAGAFEKAKLVWVDFG